MSASPKETNDFINGVIAAWEQVAKDVEFADLTLAQLKTKLKPSFDLRAEVASLETRLVVARRRRDLADQVSNEECRLVVNGVKSHRDYGENSALYKAMGYVPKDERRSGLVRLTEAPPTVKAA